MDKRELARDIAEEMGLHPDHSIHTENDGKSAFIISFTAGGGGDQMLIKGRYASSETDTLRIYAEAPAYIDTSVVIVAAQRALFKLLGRRGYLVNGSSNSSSRISGHRDLADILSYFIQGGAPGEEIIIDLDDIPRGAFNGDYDPNDNEDRAMKSYGGISFQSQFMDLEVQGDTMHVDLTPPQRFRSSMLNGITPVVTSVKAYTFNPQDLPY